VGWGEQATAGFFDGKVRTVVAECRVSGSFDCAAHDEAVSGSAQDDRFWVGLEKTGKGKGKSKCKSKSKSKDKSKDKSNRRSFDSAPAPLRMTRFGLGRGEQATARATDGGRV